MCGVSGRRSALTKGQARQARAGSARMAAVSSSTATRTGPLYSEIGTRLGRWPYPTFPRNTPNVPQSFLVHAAR
jgi:hypothetical protein